MVYDQSMPGTDVDSIYAVPMVDAADTEYSVPQSSAADTDYARPGVTLSDSSGGEYAVPKVASAPALTIALSDAESEDAPYGFLPGERTVKHLDVEPALPDDLVPYGGAWRWRLLRRPFIYQTRRRLGRGALLKVPGLSSGQCVTRKIA